MSLPAGFQFSQVSLQDYVDCARRFQLRYLLLQPWPALITARAGEAELHMRRGAALHHLAHQYALGIEPARLMSTIQDAVLAQWWRTFLDHPPPELPATLRQAEVVLSAPLSGYRLVAKLDLVSVDVGQRYVIVDWKTQLKRPSAAKLAKRLQTRVYRYLAVEAGGVYNGGHSPKPSQVEMVYWFAALRGETRRLAYDAEQCEADRRYLSNLISQIAAGHGSEWPLTSDEQDCSICNYRTLCDRRVRAGSLIELDDDLTPTEIEIDLEQVGETEF